MYMLRIALEGHKKLVILGFRLKRELDGREVGEEESTFSVFLCAF